MKLHNQNKTNFTLVFNLGSSFFLLVFQPTSNGLPILYPNPNRKPPNDRSEIRREVQQRKRERRGEQFPIYQNLKKLYA